MKKLISLAIAAVFVSTALVAQAEILKNLTTSGEVEVQYLNMRNHNLNSDTNDEINQTLTRVMYGLNFDLLDDVNAQISLYKNDRRYGTAEQTLTNVEGLINISEAYINLKDVLYLNHKLGRQYFGEPGDLIAYYGPERQPWRRAMNVTALDGWLGTWTNDKLAITGGLVKVADVGGIVDSDTDLKALVANYNADEKANITGYWYNRVEQNPANPAAGNPTDHLNVIGAKATGKVEGFHYKGELAVNTGKAESTLDTTGGAAAGRYNTTTGKYNGVGFLANVGYDFDLPVGMLGAEGEFASGSGDNTADEKDKTFYAIASDYRPGIIFGGTGLADWGATGNAGIGNLTTWNLGVKFTPKDLDKLTTALKYYSFSQTKIPANVTTYKKILGNEIDFVATWKHSDNVSLRGSLAKFTASEDSWIAVTNHPAGTRLNPAFRVGLDCLVKF